MGCLRAKRVYLVHVEKSVHASFSKVVHNFGDNIIVSLIELLSDLQRQLGGIEVLGLITYRGSWLCA